MKKRALGVLGVAVWGSLWGCHRDRGEAGSGPREVRAQPGVHSAVQTLTAVPPMAQPVLRSEVRVGDVVLRGTENTMLVFGAAPDMPGEHALCGSLLDARVGAADSDPLFYARAAWFDAAGRAHPLQTRDVTPLQCPGGHGGVRVSGTVDGVRLEQSVCVRAGGHFDVTTRALSPLPAGASLGEQLDSGASAALVDGVGEHWTDRAATSFLAVVERGQALLLEGPGLTVLRGDGGERREHDDLTALLLQVRFRGSSGTFRLTPVAGDALDALNALAHSSRAVTLQSAGGGEVELLDGDGHLLAHGALPASGGRVVRLPVGFGAQVRFRDAEGIESAAMPLGTTVSAPAAARARLRLRYTDGQGHAVPVHVMVRALDEGRRAPTPRLLSGEGFAGGRSVYLLRGEGEIALPAGRYRLTANHGPRYSLDVHELVVAGTQELSVEGTVREVVAAPEWIAADLHLHQLHSPDSHVTLEERVGALRCEGVDFAVATDHNHVTDYAPAIQRLRVSEDLAAIPGIEVTTFSPTWGHFIAFPMRTEAPRNELVVPFLNTTPTRVFADARSRGAQIIQVNHPRLEPNMGYLNFVHFDPRSGQGDHNFAAGFDAVEVFNGWLHEHPEEVRVVLRDFVGLVRHGVHPAATGNSDSHYLVYEEAGWPRTYIAGAREPVGERSTRVLEGLRGGHTTVSGGPFITLRTAEGATPGDTVRPANGMVRVHLRVEAPAWVPVERVELWIDDHASQTFTIDAPPTDGVRFERDLEVPVAPNQDVLVMAWADARTPLPDVLPSEHAIPMGFTSPLYVDADGDGRIRLAPGTFPPPPARPGSRAGR